MLYVYRILSTVSGDIFLGMEKIVIQVFTAITIFFLPMFRSSFSYSEKPVYTSITGPPDFRLTLKFCSLRFCVVILLCFFHFTYFVVFDVVVIIIWVT